ncbi:MAG: pleC [Polyangiaceae bacterium]|jgi:signal transduction histidine kinase|nr:pleC [Polyangiaceae bacterium]
MGLGEPDFRVLFESSPDVLLVLLPDAPRFTMVAATDARLAATHTTREATLGHGLFEVFPDNPDELGASGTSNLRASLERVVETRTADTMAVQKYDIRGPDGTFQKKYWSPKNVPVLSPSGQVAYILHRVEDVTDLVEASELGKELRDRTKQAERDVIARSRELHEAVQGLRNANTKLGELDTAKTAFFSNVSHEFRTPLTLILGPLESALSRDPAFLDGEELAGVHRNALRLLRLVNSLLDFSRIEAGRLELRFAPTDLSTLTAGLGGAFQSLFDDAGLRLRVDCPPLPEPVYVDPAQWEKIVLNLVSNAFKFTFEGGVEVALSWHGDHVELHVRDTGTGIPEEELPRVFERFHRVQGAEGRSYEGSGIGLSLVNELARLHGGTVRVESAPGRGSTFTVSVPVGKSHLPPDKVAAGLSPSVNDQALRGQLLEAKRWLKAQTMAPSTPPPRLQRLSSPPHSVSGSRGRILVADDNSDMREYIERLLAPHWAVQVVPDGRAALDAARESPPDLVLSDMMMPGMDGVSLLNELRADERTNTIPVILISARAGEEARLEGLETGADDYLIKPFAARELLTRVNTHLEMARVRRNAYDQLAAAQAQLVQSAKMASLGQLVAGIAHEINNPLAFALSHLSTVERSLADVESKLEAEIARGPQVTWQRARTRAEEMRGGLQRIQELVLKLRTFSRLDEGELKPASVRDSVGSALTILNHRLEGRIRVTTHFGEPDVIYCYAGLLNQAIMNLLTNAIDAIEGTGTVHISSGAEGKWYVISIEDSGAGIPEDIREQVFNPFFTTKPVGEGTGLGLSITYSIIKKHGGSIELERGEGGGTRATITLPLRTQDEAS